MTLNERIESFVKLGDVFRNFPGVTSDPYVERIRDAAKQAQLENPWFIQESISQAILSLSGCLRPDKIIQWLEPYMQEITETGQPATVAVVMAGNIPLVGFHDFLCVLITGNRLKAKLSGQDAVLLPAIADVLIAIDPRWKEYIDFTKRQLDSFDAIIATGSNNSSLYFEYYFGKYPNIIRKNRNSIAILTGEEKDEDLNSLADDILLYFGLGCRSVSKLYIPYGWDLAKIIPCLGKFEYYRYQNKYRNNYDYFKSIYMVNKVPFLDTGDILLTESTSLSSPVSVLFYEYYHDITALSKQVYDMEDQLQCVVCLKRINDGWVMPGMAQHPELLDYADNIDTIRFLLDLNKIK
jgi:hypothetical protein